MSDDFRGRGGSPWGSPPGGGNNNGSGRGPTPPNIDAIIKEIESTPNDFICLNFANPDMVGHTGVYKAVIEALEVVDKCANQVVEAGLKQDYAFMIIADHGNADFAINTDGTPNTAHTKNPVPCFAINTGFNKIENGKLADIAPTILQIMDVKIPNEMTGNSLIR